MSLALIGSVWEDSKCELEGSKEEGVRFCGDLLLSLFSSESLFSPPSGVSPPPRRFPPLARVEGGERRPCFFIGFIVSCSFSPSKLFYLFVPEIVFGVPLSRSVLISILPPLYFPPLPGPLALILSSLPGFSTCPPYSRDSERKGSVGYSCGKHFQTCTKLIRHTT